MQHPEYMRLAPRTVYKKSGSMDNLTSAVAASINYTPDLVAASLVLVDDHPAWTFMKETFTEIGDIEKSRKSLLLDLLKIAGNFFQLNDSCLLANRCNVYY